MNSIPKIIINCECLIIGGGPAGLTAAIYLARFRRNVVVVDEGKSRALYIKTSYNYPGFDNGIQGEQLLHNLSAQAEGFGTRKISGKITSLEKDGPHFIAESDNHKIHAAKVLLATGVVDEKPNLPNMNEFIYEGAVRFCPVCDGFEALDKTIGVMGPISQIIPKGLFLRTYTKNLHLLPTDHINMTEEQKQKLKDAAIALPNEIVADIKSVAEKVAVILQDGKCVELDVLYPAMGANPRTGMAIKLGAKHNDNQCLLADAHQQTCIKGLYVAGDLTTDLSQVSVATGQAAIAATHMHNALPLNIR